MKLVTPEENDNLEVKGNGFDASRRRFFQLTGGIAGAGVLLKMVGSALPLSAASFTQKEKGKKGPASVLEALNLALELEYFEHAFYHTANNSDGLIPMEKKRAFEEIELKEQSHIDLLVKTITDIGGVPYSSNRVHSDYDFTRGGVYPVFTDYETFLMSSQALENAGVRAYNTLFEVLEGSPALGKVKQIAASEMKHAAHARMLRMEMSAGKVPSEFLVHNFSQIDVSAKTNYTARSQHFHLGLV